eukprot:1160656-Rhodomonas_salina.1
MVGMPQPREPLLAPAPCPPHAPAASQRAPSSLASYASSVSLIPRPYDQSVYHASSSTGHTP